METDSEQTEGVAETPQSSDDESDQPIADRRGEKSQKVKLKSKEKKKGVKVSSVSAKKARTKRTVYCSHCHQPGHRVDGKKCPKKGKAGCPCWRKRHGGCGDRSRNHPVCEKCGEEPDDDPSNVHHEPETLNNEVTKWTNILDDLGLVALPGKEDKRLRRDAGYQAGFYWSDHPDNPKNRNHKGARLVNGFTGDHFDVTSEPVYSDEELAELSDQRLLQLAHEHFRPYKAHRFAKRKINGKIEKVQELGILNDHLLPRLHKELLRREAIHPRRPQGRAALPDHTEEERVEAIRKEAEDYVNEGLDHLFDPEPSNPNDNKSETPINVEDEQRPFDPAPEPSERQRRKSQNQDSSPAKDSANDSANGNPREKPSNLAADTREAAAAADVTDMELDHSEYVSDTLSRFESIELPDVDEQKYEANAKLERLVVAITKILTNVYTSRKVHVLGLQELLLMESPDLKVESAEGKEAVLDVLQDVELAESVDKILEASVQRFPELQKLVSEQTADVTEAMEHVRGEVSAYETTLEDLQGKLVRLQREIGIVQQQIQEYNVFLNDSREALQVHEDQKRLHLIQTLLDFTLDPITTDPQEDGDPSTSEVAVQRVAQGPRRSSKKRKREEDEDPSSSTDTPAALDEAQKAKKRSRGGSKHRERKQRREKRKRIRKATESAALKIDGLSTSSEGTAKESQKIPARFSPESPDASGLCAPLRCASPPAKGLDRSLFGSQAPASGLSASSGRAAPTAEGIAVASKPCQTSDVGKEPKPPASDLRASTGRASLAAGRAAVGLGGRQPSNDLLASGLRASPGRADTAAGGQERKAVAKNVPENLEPQQQKSMALLHQQTVLLNTLASPTTKKTPTNESGLPSRAYQRLLESAVGCQHLHELLSKLRFSYVDMKVTDISIKKDPADGSYYNETILVRKKDSALVSTNVATEIWRYNDREKDPKVPGYDDAEEEEDDSPPSYEMERALTYSILRLFKDNKGLPEITLRCLVQELRARGEWLSGCSVQFFKKVLEALENSNQLMVTSSRAHRL
ncbi:hypothetical protein KFL_002880030 [Klebsormidium nitens]|uniref:Uncharacterized protein n=1 Tax=Klebsormidium nitens TaxID=105231 RepID=A0A0U9HVF3_KLENI|nr:hypothetical protein KFL_002880030 [Klebsormidium nitens]|eukprot:GAQ86419.1 hypothetical protein KFL_002880030 [Klebsormidium nitens]